MTWFKKNFGANLKFETGYCEAFACDEDFIHVMVYDVNFTALLH